MFSVHLKKCLAVFLLCGGLVPQFSAKAVPPSATEKTVPGELIIKFKETATDPEIAHGLQLGRLKIKRHLQTGPMAEKNHPGLTLAATDRPADEAIQLLRNHPAIEFVEPNYIYQHQAVSNDPYFTGGYLWGLYGDRGTMTNNFGSQAAEAWSAGNTGTNKVYVAVIDEGIDFNHPDLAPNIWTNPYDPVDGIDNDGNGYVDDNHGWNFADNNNLIFDAAGDDHGTHVAGTIGAKGGNGAGVAGVNWNVTIISGKFLAPGGGNTLDAVEAIDYFVDLKKRHGLNLVAINASWGGGGYSQALHSAIIRAAKAGILFVAAAGNAGQNNDTTADYPANIDTRIATSTETAASFDGVLAVAAIDRTGALASFSNYGASKVHLGAPGVSILSTYPGSSYAYMDGTSMATPHVTGAVALYASTHPGAAASAIRASILGAVLPTPSLAGKTSTGGRLNLSSIITPTQTAPAAPTGLVATAGNASVKLSWSAASTATTYAVKRATVSGGPYTAISSGVATTSFTDRAVANGSTYYYVVTASNTAGTSPNSGQVSATPKATPPPAPTGVSATSTLATVSGTSSVTLRWTASSGATSYKVKRASSSAGPWTTVATAIASTSWTQTVTATGVTWYYKIVASSSGGDSADSLAATVFTPGPTPASLTASALSSTQVQLRWTDKSSDEQGFRVEYLNGTTWTLLGTAAAGSSSVTITGTVARTTYSFRVRAYNGTLNSAYSNTATVTMP